MTRLEIMMSTETAETRRRYAIIGALTEHGLVTSDELADLLGRASATMKRDLAQLLAQGRIETEWRTEDGIPRATVYWLPEWRCPSMDYRNPLYPRRCEGKAGHDKLPVGYDRSHYADAPGGTIWWSQ